MKLRKHQTECRSEMSKVALGIIHACTGSGKSIIAADHAADIFAQGEFCINIILSPYIVLGNQLQLETVKYIYDKLNSKRFHCISVNSGNDDSVGTKMSIEHKNPKIVFHNATTNSKSVTEAINRARHKNEPLLINSTYKSAGTIAIALRNAGVRANTTHCDEAHFLLQDDNHNNVAELKEYTDNMFFYTATLRHSKSGVTNGRCHLNSKFYGDIIHRYLPYQSVKDGVTVPPRFHNVIMEGSLGSPGGMPKAVTTIYKQHSKQISQYLDAKLLVSVRDSNMLKDITESKKFKQYTETNNITVFEISSARGHRIDGKIIKDRGIFLDRLRNHKGKMIALHIKILTAGIDVPGFTAGVAFKGMGKANTLQFIGRMVRLHDKDKAAMKDRSLEICDFDNYLKPHAWIIIPVFDNELVDAEIRTKDMITHCRDAQYDAFHESVVITDTRKGKKDKKLAGNDKEPGADTSGSNLFRYLFEEIEKKSKIDDAFKDDAYISATSDDINTATSGLAALL